MSTRASAAHSGVNWWKTSRVAVLLAILATVAATQWQSSYRSTRWRDPLFVAIYPIAADSSAVTHSYINAIDAASFEPIDAFFAREAARHHLSIAEPIRTRPHDELTELPPHRDDDAGVLATAWWSLRLRYWAFRVSRRAREPEDIRIFVLYHDPALTPTVPHSLGLTKGLIGVVYAFAAPSMNGTNAMVIAHELLHTVGASDKYRAGDDAPRFPDGYGDVDQRPLYPQRYAELMAGRRMLAADRWEQPAGLDQVRIGASTAREIRWPENADP